MFPRPYLCIFGWHGRVLWKIWEKLWFYLVGAIIFDRFWPNKPLLRAVFDIQWSSNWKSVLPRWCLLIFGWHGMVLWKILWKGRWYFLMYDIIFSRFSTKTLPLRAILDIQCPSNWKCAPKVVFVNYWLAWEGFVKNIMRRRAIFFHRWHNFQSSWTQQNLRADFDIHCLSN